MESRGGNRTSLLHCSPGGEELVVSAIQDTSNVYLVWPEIESEVIGLVASEEGGEGGLSRCCYLWCGHPVGCTLQTVSSYH